MVRALVILSVFCSGSAIRLRDVSEETPVARVVSLLTQMKHQVEAEADQDAEVYGKMDCWCKTNEKEKTESIAAAEERLKELAATIEEGEANAARLADEIEQLNEDIADIQDSLQKAQALREKENAAYEEESKDMMDVLAGLNEAIPVLSKVQFLQSSTKEASAESLMQVRAVLEKRLRLHAGGVHYTSVMQRDLFDLLGSLPHVEQSTRVITGLVDQGQPTGAAAGATSYTARSSSILGMLKTMQDKFEKDLKSAQKQEIQAEISYQRLKSTKQGELHAATRAVDEKTTELAETNERVAQAKEDTVSTQTQLAADQVFLADLLKRCATAETDFNTRTQTRQEEVKAIAETIVILTGDEARDKMSNTFNFVQVASRSRTSARRARVAEALMASARRLGSSAGAFQLAALSAAARLDAFTKVKEMMDKMIVELKKQQGSEVEKKDACQKDIFANEKSTREKTTERKDIQATVTGLEGKLAQLGADLEELDAQVKATHVSMQTASEDRKAENHEFQEALRDQTDTVEILEKALARLRKFYGGGGSFLDTRQEPPAAGVDYKENAGSSGVIQMLEKIAQDARNMAKEALASEQASQDAYSEFVANTNGVLDSAQQSITEKTTAQEQATADKLTANQDLRAADDALAKLADLNKNMHLSCDYVMKNFDARQQARQQEIEAIRQAKSILNGADFS